MSVQRAKADLANLESQVQQYRVKMQEAEFRASKLRTYIEVSQEYDGRSVAAGDPALIFNARDIPTVNKAKATGERGITSAAVEVSIELLERSGPHSTHATFSRCLRIGTSGLVARILLQTCRGSFRGKRED